MEVKDLKVNIVAGTEELRNALKRYLNFVLNIQDVNLLELEGQRAINSDVLNADMWIVEVFLPYQLNNPAGFRTVYKLLKFNENLKFLLIFPPFFPEFLKHFPEEGAFWWSVSAKTPLSEKIKYILNSDYFYKAEIEFLAKKYPQLLYDPAKHQYSYVQK